MSETLSIGVIHLDVRHGQVEENRVALTAHVIEAARRGAKIIVAPELAVSGYSFDNRDQVSACAEVLRGATFESLSGVARQYGVFVAAGIAERDPATDIYYNTALVVDPNGELAAHHRKVLAAERRWACPGNLSRSSLFDTPWGRVGALICADSYAGLLPRSLALHGADLLLVLANWPPSGVDPTHVWRARALENGYGVVGCNRTGLDRIMDCRTCRSYAVTASGEVLLDEASPVSAVWIVHHPLQGGRLPSDIREARMSERRPEEFGALYLDMNGIEDFGGFWGLPAGGPLDVRCVVPESREQASTFLGLAAGDCDSVPTLLVLPRGIGAFSREALARLVEERPLAIVADLSGPNGEPPAYGLFSSTQGISLLSGESFAVADFGPARIALVRAESLAHPEVAVSLSKQGCDLLVTCPDRFGPDDRLLLGVKCLDRSAIAAVSREGAMICEPPKGHETWKEALVTGHGVCSARLDTVALRSKRFYDRVDMEVLLRR